MLNLAQALLPVFLVILLGYALRRSGFPGDEFWPHIERVVYFVLFPPLLFDKLARAPLADIDVTPMVTVLVTCIAILASLTFLLRPLLNIDGPAFSSLFQGNVRFNSYVAIAIAAMLDPQNGTVMAAIAVMAMVPLVNVLCVLVLAFYAAHTTPNWRSIGLALLKNPLILACVSGLLVNWLAIPLPQTVWRFAEILGTGALPLGLIAVGAALHFGRMRDTQALLLVSVLCKLMIFPGLAWGLCWLLAMDAYTTGMILLFTALPTASSSYVLARQMGGAYELMANIITLQTLVATVTMPVILMLAG